MWSCSRVCSAAICSSEVKIYDTETGKLLWEHDLATNVTHVAFFPDPRFLVTVQADNLIRLWDLTEKRELCTLALFEDNNEWVVSTGDLRFDASEKAIGKMYVVKGTDIIPLESLFNQLYTPKLLSSLLTGVKLEDPKIDVQKIRVPPTVKLEFADGTLPDDPVIHACALTYASDMTLLDSTLMAHGRSVFEPEIQRWRADLLPRYQALVRRVGI